MCRSICLTFCTGAVSLFLQVCLSVSLSVCQFACLSVYVHSTSFRPSVSFCLHGLSVSLSVCTVCLSVSLSARSVCLSTRSACLCLTPNWLHLLYLSNQCVILPPIILLLALLRDLDLSRVPESSAKLERVWKPRSGLHKEAESTLNHIPFRRIFGAT